MKGKKQKLRYGSVKVEVAAAGVTSSLLSRRGEAPQYVIPGCCSGLLYGGTAPIHSPAVRRAAQAVQETGGEPPVYIPLHDMKVQAILIQHTVCSSLGSSWNAVLTKSVFSRHSGTFKVVGDKYMQVQK